MTQRKSERFDFFSRVSWDFFAEKSGKKNGYIGNISSTGCLLKTSELIENRRWLRLIIQDDSTNLYITAIGRVVRKRNLMEVVHGGLDFTLYHYGIEFTYPNYLTYADTDLIFALSRRNLSVRSCLSLNSRSPFRPGFLA